MISLPLIRYKPIHFFTILTLHIVRLYRGFELYQTHEIYKEQMSNWLIFFFFGTEIKLQIIQDFQIRLRDISSVLVYIVQATGARMVFCDLAYPDKKLNNEHVIPKVDNVIK